MLKVNDILPDDSLRKFLSKWSQRCIWRWQCDTLFSAPDYSSKDSNKGAIAEINGEDIKYEAIDYTKNKIVKPIVKS